MKVEFNAKTKEIQSETLVRFNDDKGLTPLYYGIYLTDMDKENPILYDLEENIYYEDVELYDIVPVIGDIKLVVEEG